MTEFLPIEIVYVILVVGSYELLRWRLLTATHEFRTRAGCEADRWAKDPRVHPDMRAFLPAFADKAYRSLTPWIVLAGWTVALFMPLRRLRDIEISDDPEVADEITVLRSKLFFAAVLTSPLACALAAVVLTIGLLLRGSVEALARSVAAAGNRVFAGAAGSSRPA